eukprot:3841098-Pyramimonas_sp.AAC.1
MPRVGLLKIRWAPGAAREVQPRASWRRASFTFRRFWSASIHHLQSLKAQEFARLLASARTALGAAAQDQDNGVLGPKRVLKVFEELDESVGRALQAEEAKDRQSETTAWHNWAQETMSKGVGRAHHWTSKLTSGQPQRVWRPELQTFSGRPFELL